jgi:hypothetical protein
VKLGLTLLEQHGFWMFEKRLLRRIFAPKCEVAGAWSRPHDKELHNLYNSLNIIRMIKSRRMRWAEHVACIRRSEMDTKLSSENLKGRDHLEG